MDYEAIVHRAFEGRRIVSLCSYHVHRCSPAQILDVGRRHSCTLDHPDEGWQIVTEHSIPKTTALPQAVAPRPSGAS
jgi:hypothetical protein